MTTQVISHAVNDGRIQQGEVVGAGMLQRQFADAVDFARYPATGLEQQAHGVRVERHRSLQSGYLQAVLQVTASLVVRHGVEVVAQADTLVDLGQLPDGVAQLRLTDKDQGKEILSLGGNVGQALELLDGRQAQLLRLVQQDDHVPVRVGNHAHQCLFECRQATVAVRQFSAADTFATHLADDLQ